MAIPNVSAALARVRGEGAALPVSHALMVAALTPESRESSLRLSCCRLRYRRNAVGLKPCTPLRAILTAGLKSSGWSSADVPATPRRPPGRCSTKCVLGLLRGLDALAM